MAGQMCWIAGLGEGTKVLHLRESPQHPWKPYTAFPQYRVPDLQVRGASRGWTTFQRMHQAGWTMVATTEAYQIIPTQPSESIAE